MKHNRIQKKRIIYIYTLLSLAAISLSSSFVIIFFVSSLFNNKKNYTSHSLTKLNNNNDNNNGVINPLNKSGIGVLSNSKETVDDTCFSEYHWTSDRNFSWTKTFTDDIKNKFNKNWFVDQANINGQSNHCLRTKPINTGSYIYPRSNYGNDFLQTNVWFQDYKSVNDKKGNPIIGADGQLVYNTNNVQNIKTTSYNYIRRYIDLTQNFGYDTFLVYNPPSYKDSNNQSSGYSFDDENSIISNYFLPSKSLSDTPCDVVVSKNELSSTDLDTNKHLKFNNKYFDVQNTLPLSGSEISIHPLTNVSQLYTISSFGVHLTAAGDSSYFTFIFKTDNTNNLNPKNNKPLVYDRTYVQEHIIIDQNTDAASQQSELDNIFQISHSVDSDNNPVLYSTKVKSDLIDAINGSTNNSYFKSWKISKRLALSTIVADDASTTTSSNNVMQPITADKYDKKYPGNDINSGIIMNDFTNYCMLQYWNSNTNIYTKIADRNILYGFRTKYDVGYGYDRDTTVDIAQRKYYSPNLYKVSDFANYYRISFNYNVEYDSKIHAYLYTNIKDTDYSGMSISADKLSPNQINKTNLTSVVYKGTPKPLYYNNKSLKPGGIVIASITLLISVPVTIYLGYRGIKKYFFKNAQEADVNSLPNAKN